MSIVLPPKFCNVNNLLMRILTCNQKSKSLMYNLQRWYTRTLSVFLVMLAVHCQAQVAYTTPGATYQQTFDNLYTTVPANNTTQAASLLPSGWQFVEAGTNANTTFRNDNGSSGTGDTYLDGASSSNERALGSYASGSLTSQFGMSLTNNTGTSLTEFTITYTGEQWKDGGSSAAVFNKLTFAYAFNPISLTSGTYVNVTNLDFTALVNNTTADVTTDGNAANRRTTITYTVTGISWTPGSTLFIRWTDINDAGNDDNLAIDDFSFSATSATSPLLTLTGTLAAVNTTYGSPSAAPTSFTIAGTNLSNNISLSAPTGYEISLASNTGYASSLTLTPSSGTVTTTTVYTRLSATATVSGSPYSGAITATSTGAASVSIATSSSTVSPLSITTSGATASNKTYNGTTSANITGISLNGVVNGDVLNVVGNGIFGSMNVGNAIPVTSVLTLTGTNASSYTLVQPSGLSANITPATLTINGLTANNKVFDGTTTATLSGTAVLNGVIAADVSNVIVGGTPVANFVSAAVGMGITVIVSGYTISGSASGNYTLLQPSGLVADITASPTPVITSTLTMNATYGSQASVYTITATNNPSSFNAIGLPAGLTINTLTGEISGTPTVYSATPFTVTISATNSGGTGSATLIYTINKAQLSLISASANNKVYDRTNTATLNGTLSGIVGSDVVTVNLTGTFSQVNVGNGISVISTATLAGTDASKYNLIQPTNLVANITPLSLTIANAQAQNKPFDGNTNAVITGTLTGVISPDAVTVTLTGQFTSSAVGNGISVVSTSTLSGTDAANYSLTQPTGLTANITPVTVLAPGDIAVIGYNTSGAPDNMALLILTDLYPGTVFYVNDNEVATTGGASFTDLAEGEASFTVNPGQTIPAGTVVILPWGSAAVTTTAYTWSTTSGFGLGNNNEEIYIYTAPSITSITPTTFIYFDKIGSSASSIPSGLVSGVSSILTNGTALRYKTSGALYAACKPSLLNAIGSAIATNWNSTGATTLTNTDWTFNVLPSCPTPTITASGTINAMNTLYGTPSVTEQLTVTAQDLQDNLQISVATGFEISIDNNTYTSSLTLIPVNGAITSTLLYIRIKQDAPVAGSPYSGFIQLSSTGATTLTISIPSSNVQPKTLTISGISADNKVFDGTTTATLSGTPVLNGVLSWDITNVILGGTPIADFDNPNIGSNIPVIVSGYTISGSASSNYILQQPNNLTAEITASPSPVITSALTFSATYGSLATPYQITATNGAYYYDAINLPPGLSIDNNNGFIYGTPTSIAGSPYSITISATNNGGTGTATLVYTINKATLTVSNAIGNNKEYDRTNSATYTGSLTGIIGNDNVSLQGTGAFAQVNVGTGIGITSTATLQGSDAAKYDLIQPTGIVANITPKPLTIANAAAQSKLFDGTTAATLSGTLSGVISPDVVSLTLSGDFATSSIGTNIAVTSTSTISGLQSGNYTLTQPTGLTANIVAQPVLTELIVPQFMQGVNGTNANRIPYAYQVKLSGLLPNASYRYTNQVVVASDLATSNGAGNMIFANANGFVRTSSPGFTSAGNYGTLTTDANGEYTGWFISEPTGNATRFVPGNSVYMRIALNDGNNGTTVISRVTTTSSITVLNLTTGSNATSATALRGLSSALPKNMVVVYDNASGNGRPLSASFIESDGTANTTANSYASFYANQVDAVNGAYGILMPNLNSNGVRRIEQRDLVTGAIIGCASDADGVWPSGANTVNPAGGTTAVLITNTDAPLTSCCTPPTAAQINGITTICNTDTLFLNAMASGSLPFTYQWSGFGTILNPTSSATAITGAATGVYTITVSNACGSASATTMVTVNNCSNTFHVKCFIQGYYIGNSTMNSVLQNQGIVSSSADDCDDITVELHDAVFPYSLIQSFTGLLQTDGTLTCTFPGSTLNNNYYIVLVHRNAIQTWSANPVTLVNGNTYDFSTAATQAYASNQVEVEPGIFAIISGDVNHDLAIDGFDYIIMDPDIIAGNSGYLNTDLDGNGSVDAFDFLLVSPNIDLGYTIQAP